jgi:GrpB-like predicted nucleotidyltransferase (UPF0157 family)
MSTNNPVVLVPYDPRWPIVFGELQAVYLSHLGQLAKAVEHVGSTAVPGLLAKPTIDMDIVLSTGTPFLSVLESLRSLGYRPKGDQGVPGREAFSRDGMEDVPRDGSGRAWPAHHLYVCDEHSVELRRHLLFRNWLRSDRQRVLRYAALKCELARLYRDDRSTYCEAKTEFIEAALREAISQALPDQGCSRTNTSVAPLPRRPAGEAVLGATGGEHLLQVEGSDPAQP